MKTKYFHIDKLGNSEKQQIHTILQNGGIIAFPTETVYGIGCSIDNTQAIERISELKNRPDSKAYTVHMGSIDQIDSVAKPLSKETFALLKHFCPGPITFVIQKKENLSSLVGTDDSVGIRVPDYPKLCDLICHHTKPLIGTSANVSSQKPAVSLEEVIHYFDGKIEAIIDGGTSDKKVPSTVVSVIKDPFQILRNGDISIEEILTVYKAIQGDSQL